MRRRAGSLRLGLAAGLIAGLAFNAAAHPLAEARIATVTTQAFHRWKIAVQTGGLARLQDEIMRCYAGLDARPSQARAAYCAALDHYTLLATLDLHGDQRPPYFATDAVFARLDAAVAKTTPARDRFEFTRRFLVIVDEALRADGDGDAERARPAGRPGPGLRTP